jgi:hypothetical protein
MSKTQATEQQQGGKGNLRPHTTPKAKSKPEPSSKPFQYNAPQ